ncbi:hypothetical protein LCGC14_1740830 [marine sediment metagenome]|uniref:Uncharacterized protein n=1 Tax=marine sediment metagenome TaxID=412755 RepID=A0A0F9H6S2_9ZZZZ
MSIERFIKRLIKKDTAVYWGPETSLRFDGTPVFSDPVEIGCFWVNAAETFTDDNGKEFISTASVYVVLDLVQEGMLFHGVLDDLSTAQKADPRTVHAAYFIKVFEKTPSLKFGYSRKVMLNKSKE